MLGGCNLYAFLLGGWALGLSLLIATIGMIGVSSDTQIIIVYMLICTGILSFTQIPKR